MGFVKSKKENNKDDFKFEIIEDYGVLSDNGKNSIKFRLISYNGQNPKYDIRQWYTDKNGIEKMGKGITLDGDEAEKLLELLKNINEN